MKTLFVVISKDVMRRNIFDTQFWPTLTEKGRDHKLVLVVERGKEKWYRKQVDDPRVIIEGFAREKGKRPFHRIVDFLIRVGILSHSVVLYRKRAYRRGAVGLPLTLLKGFIGQTLSRSDTFKKLLRKLAQKIDAPKRINELFDTYEPDLIFIPSMIDTDFDALFGIVARQRSVRIVGMVRSWDNLNNHGLLAVVPDRFLFQNTWLVECAEKFQGIDTSKLQYDVVGLPHYDRYKDPEPLKLPREEFCKEIGVHPEKDIIFLTGFDFYYSEDVLPRTINDLIESGKISKNCHVIFTRHTSSIFEEEEYHIDELPHVTLYNLFGGREMGMFGTEETFINLCLHSKLIINIASTVAIDAAIFGKPTICIGFDDPARKLSYYEKAERLHDTFDHYERLVSTGGVQISHSVDELAQFINEYLDDPRKDAKGQRKILENFVEPFDGKAGARIGDILAEELLT